MRWGVLYAVRGADVDVVARTLEDLLKQLESRACARCRTDGSYVISALRGRWFEQQVGAHLWSHADGATTFVRVGVVPTRRTKWLMGGLFLCTAYAYLLGMNWLLIALWTSGPLDVRSTALPSLGIGLAFVFIRILLTPSGHALARIVSTLRGRLGAAGFMLEKQPSGHRQWNVRVALWFLVFLLTGTIAVAYSVGSPWATFRHGPTSVVIFCLVMALVLSLAVMAMVGLAVLVLRRAGASERLNAALPAMMAALAACFFMVGTTGGHVFGRVDVAGWQEAFVARTATTFPMVLSNANAITQPELQRRVKDLRLTLAFLFVLILIVWGMGASFLIGSVASISLVISEAGMLRTYAAGEDVRIATEGRHFLRPFRILLTCYWSIVGTLVLGGVIHLVALAIHAVYAAPPPPHASGVTGFAVGVGLALDYVCGWSYGASNGVVRCVIIGIASGWVSLISVSLGTLLWRWSAVHRAAASDRASPVSVEEALRVLKAALDRVGLRPRVVIVDSGALDAVITTAFARMPTIILTTHLASALTSPELVAVIGHELAHHVNGDCRRHALLQLLGRLTLFGDAFVGTLENSFSYELVADRVAVTHLGVSPRGLARALLRLHGLQSAARARSAKQYAAALTIMPREARTLLVQTPKSLWHGVSHRIRLWLSSFVCDTSISYWHPYVAERIAALARPLWYDSGNDVHQG